MAHALELRNIEVTYLKTVQAVKGLSLVVPEGAIVALLGPNGAGKTSTLKAIAGLLPLERGEVAAGSIHIGGRETTTELPHRLVRAGLFHVREGRQVFADMTIEENLVAATYALTGRKPVAGGRTSFDDVYGYFPVLARRRRDIAGYLSGGEQQMLAIGRALVAKPRLILLDEPSLGLAPLIVREIFDIVTRINRETRVSMLLVEQNASIALQVAQHAYVLESGRVAIEGPTERLRENADVREFYLGVGAGHGGRRSFIDVKHYRRKKAWIS
jgi:branched-chain amino acid transport system ATP-binding protein